MPDTSLPISGTITDSQGNALAGVEVVLYRLVGADTNSDGEIDEITDSTRLARTQTGGNGFFEFTANDLPATYTVSGSEEVYYCKLDATYITAGSGDPLDSSRVQIPDSVNQPTASDYIKAYALEASYPSDSIHAYPTDEGSGSTLNDYIATAHGTINGDTSQMWVQNTSLNGGYGLSGDATDDEVVVPKADIDQSSAPLVEAPVSVGVTVTDFSGAASTTGILGNFTNTTITEGLSVFTSLNTSASVAWGWGDGNGNGYFVESDSGHLTDSGTIYRILAGTSANDDSGVSIYVNASEVPVSTTSGSGTVSASGTLTSDLRMLSVSNGDNNGDYYFGGTIDNPVIYKRSPTQALADEDYNIQPWSGA